LLAPWTGAALGALSSARAARSEAATALATPVDRSPAVRPDIAFPAETAASAIRSRIDRLARGGGVLVEDIAPVTMPAPLVAVSVR
ncbi:hypothetical protein, partial [Escherichia coli]|uniref:hypothetical protein n=2 Tax=Pseudomonadota TaxID=1224 RepID=UPI003CF489B9